MDNLIKAFLMLITCLYLLFSLLGCNNEQILESEPEVESAADENQNDEHETEQAVDENQNNTSDNEPVEEDPQEDEPVPAVHILSEAALFLKDNLPKMDGSTSLIPLEGGIRAYLFGITQAEGENQTVHSTTYGAFKNLLNGSCDLIFSTPLSKQQEDEAKSMNLELSLTPIAMEGFVFVVNAKNPINTLSQQQLLDIYSGKITNWKDVGGNDAEIIAYQRNSTSGSQNYMTMFMGDIPIMKPKTDKVPASMEGLMNAIAIYDNAENAIGYSVYAYAADMYGNGNEIKFIEVDGVAPSKKTMADGSYPLMNFNYAICDKKLNENSPAKKLIEWLLTDEGQQTIVNAGYIPVRKAEVFEDSLSLYTALGTGYEKPKDYIAPNQYYKTIDLIEMTRVVLPDSNGSFDIPIIRTDFKLKGLKNSELTATINDFIASSIVELEAEEENRMAYIKSRGPMYSDKMINNREFQPAIQAKATCINGYLSVEVFSEYLWIGQGGYHYYFDCRTAVYNIYNGKKLILSDLFYKDVDFVSALNEGLKKDAGLPIDEWVNLYETKRDFAGLVTDFDTFTAESAIFAVNDKKNIYFADGARIDFRDIEGLSCTERPRDMAGFFEDDIQIAHCFITKESRTGFSEDNYSVLLLEPNGENDEIREKINTEMLSFIEKTASPEVMIEIAAKRNINFKGSYSMWVDWKATEVGNKYAFFYGHGSISIAPETIYYNNTIIYDLNTGKKVNWTMLFLDGWRENCSVQMYSDDSYTKQINENINYDDLTLAHIMNYGDFYHDPKADEFIYSNIGNDVSLRAYLGDIQIIMLIPRQYIKWDI